MSPPFRLLAPVPRPAARVERESTEFELPDGRRIELLRVRNPRARRLRLSVDERGARLTVPPRTSDRVATQFLNAHRDWLGEQVSRFTVDALPELQPGSSTWLPLAGARVPVQWQPGRFTHLLEAGEKDAPLLRFSVSGRAGPEALRRALRDFYEARARADVGRWLPRYLSGLPRAPRRVRYKVMSSQWGSLAPDGTMALDLGLVLARPSAFEYVLVHELCHLIHADHSRAYWSEVEARSPHWRAERDYFNSEGRRLKAMMRALLGA
ncbi:SprT family zinc-dependent metalloprotease [Marilutibacter spongiae]|uniref:M48 family metallopeptidase n=1 Tax=Marilutibacter spongiae TaxID=2025720 RepID=A0A7W3TKU7_9GAMM|nr:SprT family zinc-dependent metalloprotease [Lysobacter spongiae]MBB1059949.1 M48 family metallopeptidase [Lysobacter spongiae]